MQLDLMLLAISATASVVAAVFAFLAFSIKNKDPALSKDALLQLLRCETDMT
jgi:hypothetical protein